MTFAANKASSSSEGEEDSLRVTIDSLRAENTALKQQNYQLQRDWRQINEEANRKFKTAKTQFLRLLTRRPRSTQQSMPLSLVPEMPPPC